MNEILNTRLFALLSEPSQEITNEEMQYAYVEFMKHIEATNNSGNYENIYRALNVTRIEIAHLQTVFRYE